LASQGYFVLGIDHNDRSCAYTELRKGAAVVFDFNIPLYDKSARGKQLEIRVEEVRELIKELEDKTFLG
jgi:hypothetical protein